MYMSIEPSNGVPIYQQIVRQVKFAVAEGTLVPGQLVPSVRDLARQLAVNPNTIQRAYQQLQSDEVLESLRGRGQVVCQGAVKHCIAQRTGIIRDRLCQVVEEALRSGLDRRQLQGVFNVAIEKHFSVHREAAGGTIDLPINRSPMLSPTIPVQGTIDSDRQSDAAEIKFTSEGQS